MAKKKAEKKYTGPGAMKQPKGILGLAKEQTVPVTGSARLSSPAREVSDGKGGKRTVPASYRYDASPGGSPSIDAVADSKAGKLDERREKLIRGDKPAPRSLSSRERFRNQPPGIVGPTREKRARSDEALRKVVSGEAGVKIPIEKTTPEYSEGLKRLGKLPVEGGKAPKAPKPSAFNRPLRGAQPTGGAQHSRLNSTPEGTTPEQEKRRGIYNEIDASLGTAKSELRAGGPVAGAGDRSRLSDKAQLALRHAGGFVKHQTLSAATTGNKKSWHNTQAEAHRAAVHGMLGGLPNNQKLELSGSELPCSTPGCTRSHTVKGNDVVQGNLSCGTRGGSCNIPGTTAPTPRRSVDMAEEARATKRLNS